MLIHFEEFLTFENIYLWTNLGVLPFWLMIIFLPNSRFTQIMVNSILIPLILSCAIIYVIYQATLLEDTIFDIFKLYLSLENLYIVFATESLLLVFWLHFLSINLFIGLWMSRDGFKYGISRSKIFIPLVTVYFAGPLGISIYWLIRIFYAKKLGFHD